MRTNRFPAFATENKKPEILAFLFAATVAVTLSIAFVFVNRSRSAPADASSASNLRPATIPAVVNLYFPKALIRGGEALSEQAFKPQYWQRSEMPEGAVLDLSEVRGMYAAYDLAPGAPITRRALLKESNPDMLTITENHRIVSIELDATQAAEFYVIPGTHVDVVLTTMHEGASKSEVIVQDARIFSLAMDTRNKSSGRPINSETSSRKTMSLEVLPSDGLLIEASKQVGRLSLMLRPKSEKAGDLPPSVTQNPLGSTKSVAAPAARCIKGTYTVEGIRFEIDCNNQLHRIE